MKIRMILFALTLSLFSACNKDDGPSGSDTLNYDGDNFTSPNLAPGDYETAVRFPASKMNDYENWKLTEVTWFSGFKPAECKVKIYGEGENDEPGDLLFQVDVTGALKELAWQTYEFSTPLELTGEEIWVSIAFTHEITMQSIGCDEGPGRPNGDFMFQGSDQEWTTFLDFSGDSINWNIRAKVEE